MYRMNCNDCYILGYDSAHENEKECNWTLICPVTTVFPLVTILYIFSIKHFYLKKGLTNHIEMPTLEVFN